MAMSKVKVEYEDGRSEVVRITPRAMAAAEEKFDGITDPKVRIRASYFSTWMSLHKAGKEPSAYDAWLDKIAACEDITPKGLPCGVCGAEGVCGEDEDGLTWIHGTADDRGDAEDESADPTPPSPSHDDS